MNLFFSSSDNDLVPDTVSQLLAGFRNTYPNAVEGAVISLRNGQTVEQAGRIFTAAVQTSQDELRQEAAEKQQTLLETIAGLKKQLLEQEHILKQAEAFGKSLLDKCDLQETELGSLRETITIQNRIMARQQNKLQSLLGNTIEDEQT